MFVPWYQPWLRTFQGAFKGGRRENQGSNKRLHDLDSHCVNLCLSLIQFCFVELPPNQLKSSVPLYPSPIYKDLPMPCICSSPRPKICPVIDSIKHGRLKSTLISAGRCANWIPFAQPRVPANAVDRHGVTLVGLEVLPAESLVQFRLWRWTKPMSLSVRFFLQTNTRLESMFETTRIIRFVGLTRGGSSETRIP